MYSFVVKIKQIKDREKGLLNYYNYLTSGHNGKIVNVYGGDGTIKNIILNNLERELQVLKQGKGGRKTKNFGTSLLFTFPPQINDDDVLNKEKLRKFFSQFLEYVSNYTGWDKKEIKEILFFNIHLDTKHKHFNIILGNTTKNNKKDLTKKPFLYGLRNLWNKFLLEEYNLNIKEYKTQTKKKKLEIQREVNKKTYNIKEYKDIIKKMENFWKEIKERDKETLNRYINRILKGIINNKEDMIKRNKEKLYNKLEKMEKQGKISQQVVINTYNTIDNLIELGI